MESGGDDNSRMSTHTNGVAPLPHLGIIRVEGEDATKFLQGQLTQDFALLGLSEARLAAYCSAKGRILASFVGFKRSHTEIVLICGRDILAPTLKRLSMYVLRAKVRLSDATADFGLYGLLGSSMDAAGPASSPWAKTDAGVASIVELYPADGLRRGLWLAPASEAAPTGPAIDPALWEWTEVRSGIARINASVIEAFVPQMLNYESVGGVSFKKGCYPGQEVVARSQFRGTLKRRAYIAHSALPLAAGQEVFHDADPSQPCGLVVQVAAAPAGGADAIISIQIAAAQAGGLRAGGADGPSLELLPLPYLLLADV